ncbi:hypothetical protein HLB23_37695 [Nocardia uniformis]|uniref:Uncharacterized protein n=1 Tax=Nocardia uniformis TaxID=53432 RepID=A0A849CFD9_9NOCA|nr:hypothetical protein [Nocardia uniformis]
MPRGHAQSSNSARQTVRVASVLLLALAGFLIGGAYSTWKTARPLAIGLGVCGTLAAAGAILYLV